MTAPEDRSSDPPRDGHAGGLRSKAGSNYGDYRGEGGPRRVEAGDGYRGAARSVPGGYGAGSQGPGGRSPVEQGSDFDSEYLQWREEQMRRLDEDYRSWRGEDRFRRFSAEFAQWRGSRTSSDPHAATGAPAAADRSGTAGISASDPASPGSAGTPESTAPARDQR